MTAERPDPRTPRELLAETMHALRCKTIVKHEPGSSTPYRWHCTAATQDFLATPAGARLLALAETTVALAELDGMVVISPPHHRHPDKWLVRVYDHDCDEDDPERLYGEGPTLGEAAAALEGRP